MAGWFEQELMDLWRTSKTALSGMSAIPTRYERLQWASNEMVKAHPDQPKKVCYVTLDNLTRGY